MDPKNLTQEQREQMALANINTSFEAMLRAAAIAELNPGRFVDYLLSRACVLAVRADVSTPAMVKAIETHMEFTKKQHAEAKLPQKPSLKLITE